MLCLAPRVHVEMLAHALHGLPLEACGLFSGDADGNVRTFYPCRNDAESATLYTVAPGNHLRADRDAESHGLHIIGVMHSHTHTDAYPSPTDVQAAPDPDWHYVIVSLREDEPMLRSYRIADGNIAEERVVLAD